VTRLVDRAVALNLVSRQRPANDRRVVLLTLTKAGEALLKKIAPPLDELHRAQMGSLSQKELKTLIDLLTRLRNVE
jgi:DNA-binding MarR family transcriptional regulator